MPANPPRAAPSRAQQVPPYQFSTQAPAMQSAIPPTNAMPTSQRQPTMPSAVPQTTTTMNAPWHIPNSYSKEPTWPVYGEGEPFIDWLEMMLITALSSPKHQHLVGYNQANQLMFRTPLNYQDNILLYKTLIDGLPSTIATSHASTLRRTRQQNDGTALLSRLQQEYDRSQSYTDTGKQNLVDQLRAMKRGKNESFLSFYQKFERHLTTMYDAEADIPTDKELAKLLLIGLDSQTLRENWLNHIVNDANPPSMAVWWKPNDLQYTYTKAEVYVNNVQSLDGNDIKQEQDIPTHVDTKTGGKRNDSDSTVSTQLSQSTASNNYSLHLRQKYPLLESFFKDLNNSQNKKSVFKRYREKLASKCCFHPSVDNHDFLGCKMVPPTVAEAGCLNEWCDWKTEIQVGLILKKEKAKLSKTNNATPTTAKNDNNKLQPVQESGYESENTVDSTNNSNGKSTTYSTLLNDVNITSVPNHAPSNTCKLIKHHAKYIQEDIPDSKNKSTTAVPDSGATSHFLGE